MTNKGEGPWKSFHIKIIEDTDIPKILEFLTKEFHFSEPMAKFLPTFSSADYEYVNLINSKIGEKLKSNQHLSLIAVDKITGEIASVQLQFMWTKIEADAERESKNSETRDRLPHTSQIRRVMDAVYAPMEDVKFGLFDKFEISQVVWNFIVSTGQNYRGQGLASEMFKRMVTLVKNAGEDSIIFGIYSSPFSRRCAQKIGSKEIAKSYYGAAKDETGKLVLPTANGPEDYASIMILKL